MGGWGGVSETIMPPRKKLKSLKDKKKTALTTRIDLGSSVGSGESGGGGGGSGGSGGGGGKEEDEGPDGTVGDDESTTAEKAELPLSPSMKKYSSKESIFSKATNTHARAYARTHARMHGHTHTH